MRRSLPALLCFISLIPACADDLELGSSAEPIVNGVTTHAFPSVGNLLYSGGGVPISDDNQLPWCTGTLIGTRTFLTAAHCVDDRNITRYRVFFQNAGQFGVTRIAVHPDYAINSNADIAVLKLSRAADGILPSAINTIANPSTRGFGLAGTIVGFGDTLSGADEGGIKRTGLVATADCSGVGSNTDLVCWRFETPGPPGSDSNTCYGDSGGPIFLDLGTGPVVAGTTRSGTNFTCGAPDHSYDANVFTRRAFILAELGTDPTSGGNLLPVGDARVRVEGRSGTLSSVVVGASYPFDLGATERIRFTLNGEEGLDADLYVRAGTGASPTSFDCRVSGLSSVGGCEFFRPPHGTWSAYVERRSGSGVYQVTATAYKPALETGLASAWAFVRNPADPSDLPLRHQYSSIGVRNSAARRGLGWHTVFFPGITGLGGNVQVTAEGASAGHCKVERWTSLTDGLEVHVRCFDMANNPVDRPFAVLYQREPTPRASIAYAWVHDPTSAHSIPSIFYQKNGAGAQIEVDRPGPTAGQYIVTIPGQDVVGGTALVTAYGPSATRCNVEAFFPSGADQQVYVRCYLGATPADSQFAISFTENTVPSRIASGENTGGYLWADQPIAADYIPSLIYQFNSWDGISETRKNRILRLGTGRYEALFHGLPGDAAHSSLPIVTAYGISGATCHIDRFATGFLTSDDGDITRVRVRCQSSSGAALDTLFLLTYVTDELLFH
jgi:hypothetical protein